MQTTIYKSMYVMRMECIYDLTQVGSKYLQNVHF